MPRFAIALSLLLLASCTPEAAPDNAAGSIKQAPAAKPAEVLKPAAEAVEYDVVTDQEWGKLEAKKKNVFKLPPCGGVTEEVCPEARRQKLCMCRGGGVYKCGCYAEDWPGLPPKETETPTTAG